MKNNKQTSKKLGRLASEALRGKKLSSYQVRELGGSDLSQRPKHKSKTAPKKRK